MGKSIVFRSLSYREIIRELLNARKKVNSKFNFSRLSDLMHVQKAYVSKVMREQAHFSSDQLYLACHFLELTVDETNYLQLLLEHERTGIATKREQLLRQILKIQADRRRPTRNLKHAKTLDPEAAARLAEYYCHPYSLIIHICLSIPVYQKNPKLLVQKLRIQETQLSQSLKTLERLELIQWINPEQGYRLLENHLQLSEDSPLRQPYLALFRTMAAEQVLRTPGPQRFGFSATISADESTRLKIQEEFMIFLKRAEALVSGAQPEGVYQINFDLFPWDHG